MKLRFFHKTASRDLPFVFATPAILWQIVFFYLPLAFIIISSITIFSQEGQWQGLTLEKITRFISPIYLKVIGSSLLLALSNSILCLLIGFPLAYFLAFHAKRWKNFFLFLLLIPFWTNFLLHVYAWFFVLERKGFLNNLLIKLHLLSEPLALLNSIFAIMVMMIYHYLPFMILPLYTSLEKFDRNLLDASQDLGASFFHTFRQILLPLSIRGIRVGIFLVFIPSFGEFAIPELMGGDRWMFVGNVISTYILGERTGSLGAAFTVVSIILLLIAAVALNYVISALLKPKRGSYAKPL